MAKTDNRPDKGDDDKRNKNEIMLSLVVSGTDTQVKANKNAPLHSIIEKALEQTNNVGRPPEDWEIKTEDGTLLDRDQKIGLFAFGEGTVLWLSLKAGVAGV